MELKEALEIVNAEREALAQDLQSPGADGGSLMDAISAEAEIVEASGVPRAFRSVVYSAAEQDQSIDEALVDTITVAIGFGIRVGKLLQASNGARTKVV